MKTNIKGLHPGSSVADWQVTCVLVQGVATHQNFIINVAGGANEGGITIGNWVQGQLGFSLGAEVAQPIVLTTLIGDFAKVTNPAGTAYLIGSDGNYVSVGSAIDTPDLPNSGAGAANDSTYNRTFDRRTA